MCEIYSKLTLKTSELRGQWRYSGVFIVNFKQILHIILDKEQGNVDWDKTIVEPFREMNSLPREFPIFCTFLLEIT